MFAHIKRLQMLLKNRVFRINFFSEIEFIFLLTKTTKLILED